MKIKNSSSKTGRFIVSVVYIVSTLLSSAFDVEVAVNEIAAAPSWSRMSPERRLIDAPILLRILEKYLKLEPADARKLVERLAEVSKKDQDTRSSIDGNIYVFNRLYCNVPEKVEQTTWKFFGGWVGVPLKDSVVDAMYPLTPGKDRKLELTGSFRGYFGPQYRGLSEFDFLLDRFGKRKIPN